MLYLETLTPKLDIRIVLGETGKNRHGKYPCTWDSYRIF